MKCEMQVGALSSIMLMNIDIKIKKGLILPCTALPPNDYIEHLPCTACHLVTTFNEHLPCTALPPGDYIK